MSLFKRFSNNRSRRHPNEDSQATSNASLGASITRNISAPVTSNASFNVPIRRSISTVPIQEEEILIAVVGVTGSGKSSFIQRATGRNDIEIGEGLCSMTQSVKEYSYSVGGKNFKLVDTPGFDDTEVDDEDIFEALADWLEKSYRKRQRLTGLLYLHRIISNREKGSDLRNLRVFQKLCGDQSFSNVIIGITWWDREDAEVADSREKVLKESDEFWGDMVKKGAQVVRMPLDQRGCVDLLMNLSGRQATTLAVQDEIVNQGKSAKQTNAASALVNYDKSRAARDSDKLDRMAEDLLLKAHRLKQEQDSARKVAEDRAKYEEEDERLLAEAEALLAQKKREADAFRERTEARRRRMEEIQRQLKEAEEHISDARQEPTNADDLSPRTTGPPPPAYESTTASRVQSPQTGEARPVEYERVRPPPESSETRYTLPRLEKQKLELERIAREQQEQIERDIQEQERANKAEHERRAKVLAEQIETQRQAQVEAQRKAQAETQRQAQAEAQRQAQAEAQRKAQAETQRQAQAEAQRLQAEREEEQFRLGVEYLQRFTQGLQRAQAEEELRLAIEAQRQQQAEEEAAAAYLQEVTDQFGEILLRALSPQVQPEPQSAVSRQQGLIIARAERHCASVRANILQFHATTNRPFLQQSWRGKFHEYDGVQYPGPLQDAFCDFCMAALPNAQGYWSCHQCNINEGGLAMCQECRASRGGACFNDNHTPQFVPWSPARNPGPFATCSRLRDRFTSDGMICSRCTQTLSVVYLHCCLCDRDDFDLCLACWSQRRLCCRNTGHTMWVNVWTPPTEKLLGS